MKSNHFKLFTFLGLCLLLSGMVVCAGHPYQESQEPQTAQGKLVQVDLDANTLTIEQEDSTQLVFQFDESTKVMGAEGVQGLANNAGTNVTVEYRVEGDHNIATSIEIKAMDSY